MVLFTLNSQAISFESPMEYAAFFGEHQNIFLMEPGLVKSLFFELADTPQNYNVRKRLEKKLFACGIGSSLTSNCLIDSLYQERKAKRITSKITIPIQILNLEKRRYNSKSDLIKFYVKDEGVLMAFLSKELYTHYIGVAENSKLYQLNPDIKSIRINAVFQKKIPILINKKTAKNLSAVYQIPPMDYKDKLQLKLNRHSFSRYMDTLSLNLFFKATSITLNNQTFKAQKESTLITF